MFSIFSFKVSFLYFYFFNSFLQLFKSFSNVLLWVLIIFILFSKLLQDSINFLWSLLKLSYFIKLFLFFSSNTDIFYFYLSNSIFISVIFYFSLIFLLFKISTFLLLDSKIFCYFLFDLSYFSLKSSKLFSNSIFLLLKISILFSKIFLDSITYF